MDWTILDQYFEPIIDCEYLAYHDNWVSSANTSGSRIVYFDGCNWICNDTFEELEDTPHSILLITKPPSKTTDDKIIENFFNKIDSSVNTIEDAVKKYSDILSEITLLRPELFHRLTNDPRYENHLDRLRKIKKIM